MLYLPVVAQTARLPPGCRDACRSQACWGKFFFLGGGGRAAPRSCPGGEQGSLTNGSLPGPSQPSPKARRRVPHSSPPGQGSLTALANGSPRATSVPHSPHQRSAARRRGLSQALTNGSPGSPGAGSGRRQRRVAGRGEERLSPAGS